MKIAVFSDVHGNLVALQTLLDHLAAGGFDAIYCLGDLFTPYPGSREIWDLVKAAGVQCVQGNNEAALLAQLSGQQDYRADEVRFRPFLKNAAELAPIQKELSTLPLFRSITLTEKLHLHLCHFSPDEVLRGLYSGTHFNMAEYTAGLAERVVLTGHMHAFIARDIQGKQVYTVGSAGLPLKGSQHLEYAMVEDRQGEFAITYQLLPYPFEKEIARLLRQRYLQEYGPIAWLAFDELLTQRDRIVTFFKDFLPQHDEFPAGLLPACRGIFALDWKVGGNCRILAYALKDHRRIAMKKFLPSFLLLLLLAACGLKPATPMRAAYLVRSPGQLPRAELAQHPEIYVTSSFAAFQRAARQRIGLWVDKNALDALSQDDLSWFDQLPQSAYPIIVIGYGDTIHAFRDGLSLCNCAGPAPTYPGYNEAGFSVLMRANEVMDAPIMLQGFYQPPHVEDVLRINNDLLDGKVKPTPTDLPLHIPTPTMP